MKQVSLLRSSVAAALASIVMFAVANIAYAQAGAATQSGAAAQAGSAQANSAAGQRTSGWNENAPDRGSWLSRIFGSSASGTAAPAPEAPAPTPASASHAAGSGQTDASGWSSSGQGTSGCRQSSTGEEDFLCKLARILWGPDTPQGPNRDMDDNITAGGAGG